MFSKALILVLLGSTLILARPSADNNVQTTQPKWSSMFGNQMENLRNFGAYSAEDALKHVKIAGDYTVELPKHVYDDLAKKGNEIVDNIAKAYQAQKDMMENKIKNTKNMFVKGERRISYVTTQGFDNVLKKNEAKWHQWTQEAQEAYDAAEANQSKNSLIPEDEDA